MSGGLTYLQIADGLTKPPKPRTMEAKALQERLDGIRPDLKQVADEVRPFHWEFEFPDVFFDEDGSPKRNAGFDAILGNPPYISTQTSSGLAYRNALQHRFGFVDDLYVHFVFRGFELLRTGGSFAFIISDTFFTLGTKQRLRELLQGYRLTHLGQCDPFSATVDAAIFVARKLPAGAEDEMLFIQARYETETSNAETEMTDLIRRLPPFTPGVAAYERGRDRFPVHHATQGCLRLHRTPVEPYRRALKRAFFEPMEAIIRLHNRLMEPTAKLVETWWDKIETSKKFGHNRQTILAYHKTLRPGDVTLAGLIAEGGQGIATANNMRFLGYLDGTEHADRVRARRQELSQRWESHSKVGPAFRELLKANAGNFEAVVEPLKQRFDPARDLGLKKTDIYRIVPRDRVADPGEWTDSKRREVIYNGLDGKKIWVPFRKGDAEGNKWTDIEPLFFDWSGENVRWLHAHSGRPEANMPVVRNPELYFTPGVSWTRGANHVCIKAKLQPSCVFDVNALRLTPLSTSPVSAMVFLALINSDLFSFICKKFIDHTWMVQISDLRQMPIVVPGSSQSRELELLATRAVEAKELILKGTDPSNGLVAFCRQLAVHQQGAPPYLRPSPQLHLLHTTTDCLAAIELAVNWAVERLYGVEGLGPFTEF